MQPFPAGFRTEAIQTDDATLHVRAGGKGPAVILLHGYGETGDMWAPLAAELARDHTVVVPDLRGMGLSSRPEGGYDKKTQGHDVAHVLDALQIDRADLVTPLPVLVLGWRPAQRGGRRCFPAAHAACRTCSPRTRNLLTILPC